MDPLHDIFPHVSKMGGTPILPISKDFFSYLSSCSYVSGYFPLLHRFFPVHYVSVAPVKKSVILLLHGLAG